VKKSLGTRLGVAIAVGLFSVFLVPADALAKPLSYSVKGNGIYTVSEWYNLNAWPNSVTRWGKVQPSGMVKTLAEFRSLAEARGSAYDKVTKQVFIINSACFLWSFSPKNPEETIVNRGQLYVGDTIPRPHECLTLDVTPDGDVVTSHGNGFEVLYGEDVYRTEVFDPVTLQKVESAPVTHTESSEYFLGYSASSTGTIITVDERSVVQTWGPTLETSRVINDHDQEIVEVAYDPRNKPWLMGWFLDGPKLYIRLGIYNPSSGTTKWGNRLSEGVRPKPTWWTKDIVFVPNRG